MGSYTEAEKRPFTRRTIAAVDTDGAIEVFYNGDQVYADVQVAAGGDVTFQDGASAAAAAADDSIGVPTANGVMDVSNAGCDTVGEFVDHINKSTNWRARPLAMRRADSTNNTLITRTVAAAHLVPVTLLRDGGEKPQTNTFTVGLRISTRDLRAPVVGGWTIHLTNLIASATCTKGTGTGYDDGEGALNDIRILVYSINDLLKAQRRVWSDILATTVAETYTATSTPGWGGEPLAADPGEDMLVMIQNSGTSATEITAPSIIADGYMTQTCGSRTETFRACNV
jgi:hypothetical protein